MDDSLALASIDMNSNTCIGNQQLGATRVKAGNKDDEGGVYCLVKHVDQSCSCVVSSEKFEFKKGEEPECVELVDGDYASYSWFKTCDDHVSLPNLRS
jgi:hypothetical protein